MNTHTSNLKKQIQVSQNKQQADFILRNAQIADVFSLRWLQGDLVVSDGKIIAIDTEQKFSALKEEDANGKFVIPGLIDGHIHIESSVVTPTQFSRIALPHGVTSVITDPHEIANVSGTDGIQFMLDDAAACEMDIYVMLPSSVPSTSFENTGAVLKAKDLKPFLSNSTVLGLAEVMDYPAVLNTDSDMLDKLQMALDADVKIDGHCAGLTSDQIRGYRVAGIKTDHESVTAEEALDRITQGMYVMIREGSAAKNLKALLPIVTPYNARRFLFCTDDKHLDELIEEGSIDHAVRLAIQEGMDPLLAIQLATLNAAECYGLKDKGALAPGYTADFCTLDDLKEFQPIGVWKDGRKVAENKQNLHTNQNGQEPPSTVVNTVKLPKLTKKSLEIAFTNDGMANVIEIIPNQIITKKKVVKVPIKDGIFEPSIEEDLLKLAVIERHHSKGTIGLGIIHGFGLKDGAVATTIAHDSHNLIVLGTNDNDMLLACRELEKIQGGFVIVRNGQVLAKLALPIAGLMSNEPAEVTVKELKKLHEALHTIHPTLDFHLFLTLSFVSLPVIPELKLTDTGLFDVSSFQHISLEA